MGIKQARSFALKCILWQYDQLRRSPVEGVNAAPLESDAFEWHGNFYFPTCHEHFPGMVVHFILTLPQDYPNGTPDMRLLTSFPHSHVIGSTICFSLLSEWQWWFNDLPNTAYWNPSRTVRSLLESVYVFLTVDEDKHVTVSKESARSSCVSARRACCNGCGHGKNGNVWPLEESWLAAQNPGDIEQQISALAMHEDLAAKPATAKPIPSKPKVTSPPKKAVVVSLSGAVPNDKPVVPARKEDFCLRAAIGKARAEDMIASAPSTRGKAFNDETLQDLRCSVTGVTFDHSDHVVLGFGVNVNRRPNDRSILEITTDLTPISLAVFREGKIRKSALGEPITHWFPFAINEEHWQKAKRVLPGCVDAILHSGRERNLSDRPEDKLLFVIGELWKSMAVLMMKGEAHASEKVLKGFCAFHHILLLACEEEDPFAQVAQAMGQIQDAAAGTPSNNASNASRAGPKTTGEEKEAESEWTVIVARKRKPNTTDTTKSDVLRLAHQRVTSFVQSPRARHKAACPDFGRFLPLLLLSDLPWRDVQEPFVQELLARNARWVVQAQPGLKRVNPNEYSLPTSRTNKSWDASSTGLKLTAFQIQFALSAMPWAQEALPPNLIDAYRKSRSSHRLLVRAMYNKLGGRPTQEMMVKFQREAKSIEAMTSYQDFFRAIQMPLENMAIQRMLCDAMKRSERCHYHR